MGIGHITAAFLATKLMCTHHIFSILWEVDLIDSHIGVPQLSMPKRQSSLLVFGLARLIPFVAPNIVRTSPANPQDTFWIRRVILVQKYPKKIVCGAKILCLVQNKESTWCASNFRCKYCRNGNMCILVCRVYQICANYAQSGLHFLVVKCKIRGNWLLYCV